MLWQMVSALTVLRKQVTNSGKVAKSAWSPPEIIPNYHLNIAVRNITKVLILRCFIGGFDKRKRLGI